MRYICVVAAAKDHLLPAEVRAVATNCWSARYMYDTRIQECSRMSELQWYCISQSVGNGRGCNVSWGDVVPPSFRRHPAKPSGSPERAFGHNKLSPQRTPSRKIRSPVTRPRNYSGILPECRSRSNPRDQIRASAREGYLRYRGA